MGASDRGVRAAGRWINGRACGRWTDGAPGPFDAGASRAPAAGAWPGPGDQKLCEMPAIRWRTSSPGAGVPKSVAEKRAAGPLVIWLKTPNTKVRLLR